MGLLSVGCAGRGGQGGSDLGVGLAVVRGFQETKVLRQAGGVAALWPGAPALPIFAAATFVGNLWVALGIARRRQATGSGSA